MSCWALVPVKGRAAGKGRLAGRVPQAQRLELVRQMLARLVEALHESTSIDGAVFVSVERDTIPAEFEVLPDPGEGLNAALEAARRVLIGRGVDELVVLHADLPLVTGADIDTLIFAGRGKGLALATDGAGLGTNALYLPAQAQFRFQFGIGSRRRHLEEAARAGLTPVVVDAPGLTLDIDGPEDLEQLLVVNDPRYAALAAYSGGSSPAAPRQTRLG